MRINTMDYNFFYAKRYNLIKEEWYEPILVLKGQRLN